MYKSSELNIVVESIKDACKQFVKNHSLILTDEIIDVTSNGLGGCGVMFNDNNNCISIIFYYYPLDNDYNCCFTKIKKKLSFPLENQCQPYRSAIIKNMSREALISMAKEDKLNLEKSTISVEKYYKLIIDEIERHYNEICSYAHTL